MGYLDYIKLRKSIVLFFPLFFFHNTSISQAIAPLKASVVIESIDSTKDYYFLIAKDSITSYKILSKKINETCLNVFVQDTFNLTVIEINNCFPDFLRNHDPCGEFYYFGDSNNITNDIETNCMIYFAKEIRGLCYSKERTYDIDNKEWIESLKNNLVFQRRYNIKDQSNRRNNKRSRKNKKVF